MTERTGYQDVRTALRATFKIKPPIVVGVDPALPGSERTGAVEVDQSSGEVRFLDEMENGFRHHFGCSLEEFYERLPRTEAEGAHRTARGLPWVRAPGEDRTIYEAGDIKADIEAQDRIRTALLLDRGVPKYTAETFMRDKARSNTRTTPVLIFARGWWNQNRATSRYRHLMLSGNRGVGKTYSAVWTVAQVSPVEAMGDPAKQKTAKFISAPDFADLVYDRMNPAKLEAFKALIDPFLLVIDDLGQEPMNDRVQAKFYQLVNGRHELERRTVYTTHLIREDFEQRYGSPVTDRIYSSGKAQHFRGDSLR